MERKSTMLRKAMAGILGAAIFVGSAFTGTVFAANPEIPSQIVSQGTVVNERTDKVTVEKTVAETGEENKFNITLTVTTQERLEEIPSSPNSAVVLVMDTSGSMGGDRLKAAKTAAKGFVDSYVKDAKSTDQRYAALVEFAGDALCVRGWNNLVNGTKDFKKFIDDLYVNWEPLLGYNAGTNMEAGLQLAYNLINAEKNGLLKDCESINIVLLSDGCPTYHVKESTRNSTKEVEGVQGGGSYAMKKDWQPVEAIAKTITDNDINLYSVAFETGTADFEVDRYFQETKPKHGACINPEHWHDGKHGRWKDTEQRNVADWMNSFSTKGFTSANADELSVKFESIAKLIKLGAQAWKVTDPMGDFINYTGAASSVAADDNKFTYENGVLTWDLKASIPAENTVDKVTTYTYTLTYPITLNTAGAGFVSEKAYATNGKTTLYYYLFSKVDDTTTVPDTPKTLDFNVPTVKGYLGELSFRKVDGQGNTLAGAQFAIEGTNLTGVSDANGTVTISGIPSGFRYNLTETKMDGYLALDPISFNVSYGQISKEDDGTALEVVTNIKEENPKYIVVKHEYYDADGKLVGSETESHIGYVENYEATRVYAYNGATYAAWGDADKAWTSDATDGENLGTHDDYVITLKYKLPEVKAYMTVTHEYYDADNNLVGRVTASDHAPYSTAPALAPIYEGEEYELVHTLVEPKTNTTDDAVSEIHNDFVFTFKYQVKEVGPQYSKIRVEHEYYTDGSLDGIDIENFDYSDSFVPTQKPVYSGNQESYSYVSTDGPKYVGDGIVEYTLVYSRTTEVPVPPVVDDTTIVIEKSWDGEAYDGDITFTATNERTGRVYTGTLRAGRTSVRITVPAGGTYTIAENVPEGYTVSFPDGDSVKIRTGSTAAVKVLNTKEKEVTPPPVEPTPTPTPTPGEEETIVTPPKTGSAVGGLSALFGLAAAAVVGSAVLRRKKK